MEVPPERDRAKYAGVSRSYGPWAVRAGARRPYRARRAPAGDPVSAPPVTPSVTPCRGFVHPVSAGR